MTDRPWMKFYPSDWRADPCLRMCSLSARGLWMEMLALMHEAAPYGHLVVNGRQVTERQLAQLAGCSVDEVRELLAELEEAGVYSRTDDATVYSRRMLKDQEREAQAKANGAKGGNPKVKGRVNPPVNGDGEGEDKAHKPDARDQKEIEADASISETRERTPDRFPEFWAAYPRKADKRRAEEKWRSALKRADADTIIRGAVAYAAARAGENPQFTKLPATWLNADAWANEESAHGTRNDHRPANDRPIRNPFVARAFQRYEMGAGGRAGGGVEAPGDRDAEDARGVPLLRAGG